MPIDNFICPVCKHVERDIQHPADVDEFIYCPGCSEPVRMERDWGSHKGNFILKGDGWPGKDIKNKK